MDRTQCSPEGEADLSFGQIGGNDVVVACPGLESCDDASAAVVAKIILHRFPVKTGLLVGIGRGVWSKDVDIRLGDVVISHVNAQHRDLVQFRITETGGPSGTWAY